MDQDELRLRLIEAAARHPIPHAAGWAAGVLETAKSWEEYVKFSGAPAKPGTLGLPKKGM